MNVKDLSDMDASLKIVDVINSFSLEILKAVARTNPLFLDALDSYCFKILIIKTQLLEFLPLTYRLDETTNEKLFEEITCQLSRLTKKEYSKLIQDAIQIARGELIDLELLNEISCDLIELFNGCYRWYVYMSTKYEELLTK